MDWLHLLAYITGMAGEGLLFRNEYLVSENRIHKGQIQGPQLFSEAEGATRAEIGHQQTQWSHEGQTDLK